MLGLQLQGLQLKWLMQYLPDKYKERPHEKVITRHGITEEKGQATRRVAPQEGSRREPPLKTLLPPKQNLKKNPFHGVEQKSLLDGVKQKQLKNLLHGV